MNDNDKTGIRTLEVCTRAKLDRLPDGQDKLDYQLSVSLPAMRSIFVLTCSALTARPSCLELSLVSALQSIIYLYDAMYTMDIDSDLTVASSISTSMLKTFLIGQLTSRLPWSSLDLIGEKIHLDGIWRQRGYLYHYIIFG